MAKEKPTTKLCKHCKTEIPYDAKVCPQCRKKQKGGFFKWVLIVFAALVVLGAVLGRGNSSSSTAVKTGEVTSSQPTQPSQETQKESDQGKTVEEKNQTEFHVGDILQSGDLKIVYVACGEYKEQNQFMQPTDGQKYIFLKFSVENTSKSSDAGISFYSFGCYADGYAAEGYYGGDNPLSATLSAGRTTSGCVYFSVPVDAKEIEVEYDANIFSDKKIKFIYEGEIDSGYVAELNTGASENAYHVGDVVESSRLKITYISCEEYKSKNSFIQPKDGYHFITCTFEFENVGSSDEAITVFAFDCFADGESCEGDYSRDDVISATLSAGRKAKGTVTFEVPIDATVVEVEYLSNIWTSNRVVFDAKP